MVIVGSCDLVVRSVASWCLSLVGARPDWLSGGTGGRDFLDVVVSDFDVEGSCCVCACDEEGNGS